MICACAAAKGTRIIISLKFYCFLTICILNIYGNNKNHVDFCLQGSGDLCMCCSQRDQNNYITQILLFLDNLLMFYPAFGVNLSLNRCGMFVAGRACTSIRYCASIMSITCIRTYSVVSNFIRVQSLLSLLLMVNHLIVHIFFLIQQRPHFIWISMETRLDQGWLEQRS